MENIKYTKIEDYIKNKILDEASLLGKHIVYKNPNKAERDFAFSEYEIKEIVPAPTNYISMLAKVDLYGEKQISWQSLQISCIHAVLEYVTQTSKNPMDSDLYKLILEKAKDDEPFYSRPPLRPCWTDFPKIPNNCPVCNLDCSGTMSYVCPKANCPIGMSSPQNTVLTKDSSIKSISDSPYYVSGAQTTLDSPTNTGHTLD